MKNLYLWLLLFCSTAVFAQPQLEYGHSIGGSGEDGTSYVQVDANGNVYSVGYFQDVIDLDPDTNNILNVGIAGGTVYNFYLQKTSATGNLIWAKAWVGNDIKGVRDMGLDNNGDVLITGYFGGTLDFDPDSTIVNNKTALGTASGFILKVNSNGIFNWVKTIDGPGVSNVKGVAVDGNDNIIVGLEFTDSTDVDPAANSSTYISASHEYDIAVVKYNSMGNYLWSIDGGWLGDDLIADIAVDDVGDIYVVGQFEDRIMVKLDTHINNLYTAYNYPNRTHYDAYLYKVDASGLGVYFQKWGQFSSSASNIPVGNDGVTTIRFGKDGYLYIVGYFANTISLGGAPNPTLTAKNSSNPNVPTTDGFINKMTKAGTTVWAKRLGAIAYDRYNSVAIDAIGGVYLVGSFQRRTDFDPGTPIIRITPTSPSQNADGFLQKLDSTGAFEWAFAIGGTSNSDAISDIAINNNLNNNREIYVVGRFENSMDIDPDSINITTLTSTSSGITDGFVAKYSKMITSVDFLPAAEVAISVYPNPTTEVVNVELDANHNFNTINIRDMQGRLLQSKTLEKGQEQIQLNFRGNAAGVYLIELKGDEGSFVSKVTKS